MNLKLLKNQREYKPEYWLIRDLYLRGLGFLYLIVSLIILNQASALIGSNSLLPVKKFMASIAGYFSNEYLFFKYPTLFWYFSSDTSIQIIGIICFLFSLILLSGRANFFILFTLWLIQISFKNSGQIFWSYGWEAQLLEMTFLAFFLCPVFNWNLKDKRYPPNPIAIFALRWCLFRLILGAGLIKLRGDQCWRDLTCMYYHYETQPNPHPLSLYFHFLPDWIHKLEILFNHFVEVILPFGIFGPKRVRILSGVGIILFMIVIILSGNLSWLNWATLVLAFSVFKDRDFLRFFPIQTILKFETLLQEKQILTKKKLIYCIILGFSFCYLSWGPTLNLFSSAQKMNTSYNYYHLINSYGAFGVIGKKRYEIIISGTNDNKLSENTKWLEYEFKCKPGKINKTPCLITPYHYRLDWQIWFSAMRPNLQEKWLLNFVKKLIINDAKTIDLIEHNPFKKRPPSFIKMDLYEYKFASPYSKNWWQRQFIKSYMSPISKRD